MDKEDSISNKYKEDSDVVEVKGLNTSKVVVGLLVTSVLFSVFFVSALYLGIKNGDILLGEAKEVENSYVRYIDTVNKGDVSKVIDDNFSIHLENRLGDELEVIKDVLGKLDELGLFYNGEVLGMHDYSDFYVLEVEEWLSGENFKGETNEGIYIFKKEGLDWKIDAIKGME